MHQTYHQHLEDEHKMSPVGQYLKETVYGGLDGIVTTFAVVAGFAGAHMTGSTLEVGGIAVILFGLANLFADATSMGLGSFLSIRAEQDLYKKHRTKEEKEIIENPDFEYEETIEILIERGVSKEDAPKFADLYKNNPKFWADFMMDYELEIPDTRGDNAWLNGLVTFASFLIFGAIPLLPYFFMEPTERTFYVSLGATFVALFLLGVLRWRVTSQSPFRCIGETLIIGAACAVIAYAVGLIIA